MARTGALFAALGVLLTSTLIVPTFAAGEEAALESVPPWSKTVTSAAERSTRALITTGRVNCLLGDDENFSGVRCDALGADFGAPRPDGCELEWGSTLVMEEYSVAGWGCVGDSLHNDNRLRPGRSITVGPTTCTAKGRAVTCRSTTSGYGFYLSPKRFDLLNRGGRKVLSPRGLDGLKPGMDLQQALETGTIEAGETGCTGAPDYVLKSKYRAYLVWRGDEVLSLNAWSGGIIRTPQGIGVGSTMRAAVKAHPRLSKPRRSGAQEWDLHWVRTLKSGPFKLHVFFGRSLEERRPWRGDPVTAMVATRAWKPAENLDYHGCDTSPSS